MKRGEKSFEDFSVFLLVKSINLIAGWSCEKYMEIFSSAPCFDFIKFVVYLLWLFIHMCGFRVFSMWLCSQVYIMRYMHIEGTQACCMYICTSWSCIFCILGFKIRNMFLLKYVYLLLEYLECSKVKSYFIRLCNMKLLIYLKLRVYKCIQSYYFSVSVHLPDW